MCFVYLMLAGCDTTIVYNAEQLDEEEAENKPNADANHPEGVTVQSPEATTGNTPAQNPGAAAASKTISPTLQ